MCNCISYAQFPLQTNKYIPPAVEWHNQYWVLSGLTFSQNLRWPKQERTNGNSESNNNQFQWSFPYLPSECWALLPHQCMLSFMYLLLKHGALKLPQSFPYWYHGVVTPVQHIHPSISFKEGWKLFLVYLKKNMWRPPQGLKFKREKIAEYIK